jgi:hypothetical protein
MVSGSNGVAFWMLTLGCQPARAHTVDLTDCPYYLLPDSVLSRCTCAHGHCVSKLLQLIRHVTSAVSPSTSHRASLRCVRPQCVAKYHVIAERSRRCGDHKGRTPAVIYSFVMPHRPRSLRAFGRGAPRFAPRICVCLRRQLLGVGLSAWCFLDGARHVPILQSHACSLNPILRVRCTVAGLCAGGTPCHQQCVGFRCAPRRGPGTETCVGGAPQIVFGDDAEP